MNTYYPLRFKPVYKNYLWGGTRLAPLYNKRNTPTPCAESWEISDHPDGMSMIANGPWEGRSFEDLLQEYGADILGTQVIGNSFPLLIKLIDAAKPLSIQVHPSNETEARVNGEAKTEMWYFLNDDPENVYCGFSKGISKDQFDASVAADNMPPLLRVVSGKKGDAVFVPGGRVHAIDTGCLILEVQQRSNTTYRIDDWGRMDANGNPRELHLEKAREVINFTDDQSPVCIPVEVDVQGHSGTEICRSDYFRMLRFNVQNELTFKSDPKTFHAFFIQEGTVELKYIHGQETLSAGSTILIPAQLGEYSMNSDRPAVMIRVSL